MSKKCKVLFVYPNEREMSTIPPAITLLSQLLKDNGHTTDVFDTTFYKFDDEISMKRYMGEFSYPYANTASHRLQGKKYYLAWTYEQI